jgi:uncharacterized protein YggE
MTSKLMVLIAGSFSILSTSPALAIAQIVLKPVTEQIVEDYSPRTIEVVGRGSVQVSPDQVEFSVTLKEWGDMRKNKSLQLEDIIRTMTERAAELTGRMREAGGPNLRIESPSIRARPSYKQVRDKKGVYQERRQREYLLGYTVTIRYNFKLKELDKAPKLVATAIDFGVYNLSDLRYSLRDETEARSTAYQKAVQDARTKALAYANGSGHSLGPALRIDDPTSSSARRRSSSDSITVSGSRIERERFTATTSLQVIDGEDIRSAGLIDPGEEPAPILVNLPAAPPEFEVADAVHIIFQIGPAL